MPDVELGAVDGGSRGLHAYLAKPLGHGPWPGVVAIHELLGLNDMVRRQADRLASAGYLTLAPDLFSDGGAARCIVSTFRTLASGKGKALADIEAARQHVLADENCNGKVGIIGFCMGGTISTIAGCFWELGAAISFYGAGIAQSRFGLPPLFDIAPTLKTPFLGLFGDQDTSIPINEVDGLRDAAAKAAPATEVVRYPDANHGFHCDARSSYHEASAKDAWDRSLAWLDQHLA